MASERIVEFKAYDGTKLAGTVFSAGEKKPTIIMSNGFAGERQHFLPTFAARFQAAGYTVLTFDNRNLGASGGTPRLEVDPWLQTRDNLDAFNYARTLPDVDPSKIVAWGSSMSGGNVLIAAAMNRALAGVIAQVPFVSGELTIAAAAAAGAPPTEVLIGERQVAANGGQPTLLPVFPKDEAELASGMSPAILKDEGCMRFKAALTAGGHNADPMATLQSLVNTGFHEPVKYVHRIAPTPLLMLVGDKDTICGAEHQLAMFEKAGEPKTLHVLKGATHFDPYLGECFEENIKVQLAFLKGLFA